MRTSDRPLARLVLIGDSGVGKASLITRATPTSDGWRRRASDILHDERSDVPHLWDTAVQEVYRSIVPLYFRQATCAIVVFSLDDPNSFHDLDSWLSLLYSRTNHNVPAVIVAHKSDLPNPSVPAGDITDWAEGRNFKVFNTSAATDAGITELLEHVSGFVGSTADAQVPTSVQNDIAGCC
jgi:small GTP-binding protein